MNKKIDTGKPKTGLQSRHQNLYFKWHEKQKKL